MIKGGFLQPRKQLGNALPVGLAALGVKLGREQALAALSAAGVEPSRRAETVSLAEWAAIISIPTQGELDGSEPCRWPAGRIRDLGRVAQASLARVGPLAPGLPGRR